MDSSLGGSHEFVGEWTNEESGLHVIVALHSTRLGPAIGGTRLKRYASYSEANEDVLRLSEAMTYKAALAEVHHGGGKAVIPYFSEVEGKAWADPEIRARRLTAYAHIVDRLGGRFITAEDANISPGDMALMRQTTPYVGGLPRDQSGSGDPAPVTVHGVVRAMQAIAEETLGVESLRGIRVAVQGLGNVGMRLVGALVDEGARVTAADIREDFAQIAYETYGIDIVSPASLLELPCDVFAPCAYGGVLNATTIPRLRCRAVVGSANNQLETEADGDLLHDLGIVYGVDYVVNAGGLINVVEEFAPQGYDQSAAMAKAENIYHTVKRVLASSQIQRISMARAAQQMAKEAILVTAS